MDFSQIKNIVSGLVDNVSEKTRNVAGNAADKAKSAGRIAKLTLEMNGEKESLKKTFAAIGEAYYQNKTETPEGLLAQLCEEADSINERINAIEAELLQLKTEFAPKEADVEVSFEEVVDEAEKDAGIEETPVDEETAIEEVLEKVENIAEEVKESVDEVIDAIEAEDKPE